MPTPLRHRARLLATCLLAMGASGAVFASPASAIGRTHLVGTYDGKTLRLYIDGRPAEQRTARLAPGTPKAVEIGTFLAGDVFNGEIDDVALYDRPLDPSAIRRHFRVGTGRAGGRYSQLVKHERGVVSYWRLGDPDANQARDSVGPNSGIYRNGVRQTAPGLISHDRDTGLLMDGNSGGVVTSGVTGITPSRGFTLEAWVKAKDNRDATIVTTVDSGFLKTDGAGQFGFGLVSGKRLDSVYSHQHAAAGGPANVAPATPATQTTPAADTGGNGGSGVWTIVIGLLLVAGLGFAFRELVWTPNRRKEPAQKNE
jgi:Concanavalin A-like lectin/glucanases superfamily